MRSTPSATKQDLTALLGACCMFLSLVEYMIPKPVPFLRLGLANLPVLISLGLLSWPHVLLVAAIKIVGQGLVTGTLFSYVFLLSAVGSLSSAGVMIVAWRLRPRITLVGISLLGSMASTVSQLSLASVLVFGRGALLIAPPFLGMGMATAVVLGYLAAAFQRSSRWYQKVRRDDE